MSTIYSAAVDPTTGVIDPRHKITAAQVTGLSASAVGALASDRKMTINGTAYNLADNPNITVTAKLPSVLDDGAVGDGSTDCTSAFNAAMNTGVVNVPAGTFMVGALTAPASKTITFNFQSGAIIKLMGSSTAPLLNVPATTRIVMSGPGALDGNRANQTATTNLHGIYLNDQGMAPLFDGVTFTGFVNNPVNAAGTGGGIVRNCTISNCGQAFLVVASPNTASTEGWQISGSVFDYSMATDSASLETGLKLHGQNTSGTPTNYLDGSTVSGNRFLMPTVTSGAVQAIGCEVFSGARYTAVTGNTTTGGYMGLSIDSSDSVTVSGNTVTGASGYGVELPGTYNDTITGNTVNGCGIGIVVQNTRGSYNLTIANNIIKSFSDTAVSVTDNAHDITIAGNQIVGDGAGWAGIHLQSGAGARHTIRGNTVTAPSGGKLGNGVLAKVADVILDGNTFYNVATGIQDQSGVTGLRITGNNAIGTGSLLNLTSTPLVKASNTSAGAVA